jgi:translation initiation factor IF-3
LDLVEVAPFANPPVCRILDYSQYKYELEKKLKQRKKEKELKTIRIKPFIKSRDLEIKINHIRDFLEKGHKVRVEVICGGYRKPFVEMVDNLLACVREKVSDIGAQEYEDRRESGTSIIIFVPKKQKA